MSTVLRLPTTAARRPIVRAWAATAAILTSLVGAWILVAALPLARHAAPLAHLALLACAALGLVAVRRPRAPASDPRARVAVLRALMTCAGNPIAAHALAPDKRYFADDAGFGGVAHRVRAGVALAAGEPVGPEERRLALAAAFIAHCRAHRLIPAFYQVLDRDVDAYRALGLAALKIGEEAMIDLPRFSLAGKRIANVRHCVTHCERASLRAELHEHGVQDETTLAGLEAVSDAWLLARAGRGEMGFSMGRFSRESLRSTCVALARDAQGRVCAFVTFLRVGGDAPIMVLDLMRRDEEAPSGTIDFVIARALEGFRDAGYLHASLSLAPLAGVDGDGRQPRVERLLRRLYDGGNGLYRYRSLYNFKRKFAPRWEARYLLFPAGIWNLFRVGLAVGLVHMPSVRKPTPREILSGLVGAIRQSLDWRRGLEMPHLRFNLRLMVFATLVFSVPELVSAVQQLGRPHIAHAYGVLALALAAGDASGALALARRMDLGRRLLALAAAGFFVKTVWSLAAGYDGGPITWLVALVLAPVEVWVMWFLLQAEVRSFVRGEPTTPKGPVGYPE